MVRVLEPVLLQRAEVIGVPNLLTAGLEQTPVALALLEAKFLLEVRAQVANNLIVVQECVVHIEEKDDPLVIGLWRDGWCGHRITFMPDRTKTNLRASSSLLGHLTGPRRPLAVSPPDRAPV